jgi:hypothetical protein
VAVFALTVFLVAYLLIATEKINKVKAALGGAAVIAAAGIAGADDMFYSHETGIDWNVIFLLLGMMVIVGVLRQTGVFEYIAIWASKRAKGSALRVMILLALITAVASALLDNVTTVLLIAPVTLLVCERLGVNPVPFLIAEVFASNIGGAATLVGDPPNIIIASRAGLSFNDFLLHMAPLVIIVLTAFLALLPLIFRHASPLHGAEEGLWIALQAAGRHAKRPADIGVAGIDLVFRHFHQLQPRLVDRLQRSFARRVFLDHAEDLHVLVDVDIRDGIVIDRCDHGLRMGRRAGQRPEADGPRKQKGHSSGALDEAGPGHGSSFFSRACRRSHHDQWPLRPPMPSCTLVYPRSDCQRVSPRVRNCN